MKYKTLATPSPIKKISPMKSQLRGQLVQLSCLICFLFIAASVLPTAELVAQCPVSNTLQAFKMISYTSSGQSFVPTCSGNLLSMSYAGSAAISKPDQVDVILGEPDNSGGILYSNSNPQWSGNTQSGAVPVSVTSGQKYTVLFIRRFTSIACYLLSLATNRL